MNSTARLSQRCLPGLAAVAAAIVGLVNIASTLTPNIRWRGHLLLQFEPVEAMRVFHAFALPAGTALVLVAPYLLKRRRRAWQAAIVLMVSLGLLDLLKGLDFEETAITWATAALLATAGSSFRVRHDPISLRSAVWRVPALALAGVAVAALAIWAQPGHPSFADRLPRDARPAALAQRAAALRAPPRLPPLFRVDPARCAHGADRRFAGDRVRDLPAAGGAARAPRARAAGGGARACPRARQRHAVVLQVTLGQALLLQRRPARVRRLPDRERGPAAVGRPGRAVGRGAGTARAAARVHRHVGAEARRCRRQRGPARALP